MSENDLAGKLAAGLRRARQTLPDAAPATTPTPVARTVHPAPPPPRFAQQGDQSPPASLDQPWVNLHPERVWPD